MRSVPLIPDSQDVNQTNPLSESPGVVEAEERYEGLTGGGKEWHSIGGNKEGKLMVG